MYTIEELCELTGYKKNTLYNLCNDLDIDGIKGKIPGNPGKALYYELDLTVLKYYQDMLTKHSKAKAIELTLKFSKGALNGS